MALRAGDKMQATKQHDNSYNVRLVLLLNYQKHYFCANTFTPIIYANRMRNLIDNPVSRDIRKEIKVLTLNKDLLEMQINKLTSMLTQ